MYTDTMHGLLMQLSTCTSENPDVMAIVIYKNHYNIIIWNVNTLES